MENLMVKGNQEFMGINIPVIEGGFGNGKKVMLAKTISEIHGQPLKKINQLINDNLDEFEIGIDIIDLKSGYLESTEFLNCVMNKQSIANSSYIYLLSEQGYMALTSLMKTEKAKEIRKKLRREYFTMRGIINSEEQLKAKLLLSIYNGGQEGVIASKKLTEIEIKAATKPLIETIDKQSNTIVQQEEQIENEKPLVKFALDMQKSEDCILIRKAAKILSDNGIKIGEKRLFTLLREHKMLMDNKDNEPYQKYKDAGIFTVRANTVNTRYGTVKMNSTTLVTGKGLIYLYGKLREWYGLESDSVTLEEFKKQMKEAEKVHKYDWLDAM